MRHEFATTACTGADQVANERSLFTYPFFWLRGRFDKNRDQKKGLHVVPRPTYRTILSGVWDHYSALYGLEQLIVQFRDHVKNGRP